MSFKKDQPNYRALRAIVSERTRKFTVWCGAGLSASAGLPSWKELRDKLQVALRDKAVSLDSDDGGRMLAQSKAIGKFENYWVAFEMLKKELGEASYQQAIRAAFSTAVTTAAPEVYTRLWQLPVAGLLNLNLDRLATKAFVDSHSGLNLAEFSSKQVGPYTHLLNSPQPWVYNLHGTVEDSTSWVLTHGELRELTQGGAYLNFIRSVLSTTSVLFVGVTADDVAVGGHLEVLAQQHIHTGPHFWLTDRTDRRTDEWAEAAGLLVIRYPAGEHDAVIEALNDLRAYVPPEEPDSAPPVVTDTQLPPGALPDAIDLLKEDAETIRVMLNKQATEILTDNSPESLQAYDAFCEEYDEAIHRAWYTSSAPGRNMLLGYNLHDLAATGAFGKVFRGTAPDGTPVAVKVLLDEIRTQPQLLHSFRRGVQSMKILGTHRVPGMVPYRDASEIPAFVVMDWIEGANLKDAVLARRLDSWSTLLCVMREFASILKNAHGVPERVLHRDLRPANVMIENVWSDEAEWRVVVLDFDLSWHRGAFEKSVIHGSGTAGYLAPEQIERQHGVSTRHSAVDSFGFGMSLFFVVSGKDPVPDQHRHANWEETVMSAASSRECRHWRSVPSRVGRLVLFATRDRQEDRWDMSQMEGELLRLSACIDDPHSVRDADLIAEEIAARSDILADYVWDQDRRSACVKLTSGLTIELRGDESSRKLFLSFSRLSGGSDDWQRLARWIPKAMTSVKEILRSGRWAIEHDDSTRDTLAITGSVNLDGGPNMEHLVSVIDKAGAALRFT